MDFNDTYQGAADLAVYLTMDFWRGDHVPEILAGIDPSEPNKYTPTGPSLHGCTIYPLRYSDQPSALGQYIQRKTHIENIWGYSAKPKPCGTRSLGDTSHDLYTLQSVLQWAKSKKIFIEWEEWATANGYAHLFDFSEPAQVPETTPTGAQDEIEKPLAGKTRNTMLRTIYALCVAVNDKPSGNKTKDAASILAAMKAAGLEHPVTDKKLGDYMTEGKALTAKKMKQDSEKRK